MRLYVADVSCVWSEMRAIASCWAECTRADRRGTLSGGPRAARAYSPTTESRPAPDASRLELSGRVTQSSLEEALRVVEGSLRSEGGTLLIDARRMESYEPGAKDAFVHWNAERRGALRAVAVLTENALWHAVVAAMGFASAQKLRAFRSESEALAWLASHG